MDFKDLMFNQTTVLPQGAEFVFQNFIERGAIGVGLRHVFSDRILEHRKLGLTGQDFRLRLHQACQHARVGLRPLFTQQNHFLLQFLNLCLGVVHARIVSKSERNIQIFITFSGLGGAERARYPVAVTIEFIPVIITCGIGPLRLGYNVDRLPAIRDNEMGGTECPSQARPDKRDTGANPSFGNDR
jgi:hypothetical protein